MTKIKVSKVFCLDENYKFPRCHKCKGELSPFRIDTDELNKCSDIFIKIMIELNYIRFNLIKKDVHLIWLCKYCLSHEILIKDK